MADQLSVDTSEGRTRPETVGVCAGSSSSPQPTAHSCRLVPRNSHPFFHQCVGYLWKSIDPQYPTNSVLAS